MIVTEVNVFIAPGDERDISVEFGSSGTIRVLFGTTAIHWLGDDHNRERAVEDLRHAAYLIEQGEP